MLLELLTLRIRQILAMGQQLKRALTSCYRDEPIVVPPSMPYSDSSESL
mgnify:FL=1|tara:strand:+ start:832 stop:978 length:147 start_codon:yes stop_codon:yes gene_type:complete